MKTSFQMASWVTLSLLGAAWITGTATAQTMPAAPAYSWLMDDGSNTAITAQYGGINGTEQSASWSTDTPFAYSGDYSISASASAPGVALGSAGTISVWANAPDTSSGAPYLFDNGIGNSDPNRTIMYESGNTLSYVILNGTGGAATTAWLGSTFFTTAGWHLYTLTWDSSGSALYVDGTIEASSATGVSTASTAATMYIGEKFDVSHGWSGGGLDEFAIWNTKLSADNVAWLSAHSLHDLVAPTTTTTAGGTTTTTTAGGTTTTTTTSTTVTTTTTTTTTAAQTMPPAPAYSWLMDDGSGTAITAQYGGINGTEQSASWSTDTPFGYSGDYSISASASAPNIALGAAGTISVWGKAPASSGAPYLFDNGTSNSDPNRTIMYYDPGAPNYLSYLLKGSAWNGVYIGSPAVWHLYTLTWDNSGSTLYEDGVLLSPSGPAGAVATAAATWYMGVKFDGSNPWSGLLDEFAIWNTKLSADNVAWLSAHSLNDLVAPTTTTTTTADSTTTTTETTTTTTTTTALHVTSIGMQAGKPVVGWNGSTSGSYTVQFTPSLFPFTPWSDVTDYAGVPGVNGPMSAVDTNVLRQGFYRIRMTQ